VSGHILAIGGGDVLSTSSKLEELLLELSGKARPRIAFLPTAAADSGERIALFHDAFRGRDCEPEVVTLFEMADNAAERVAAADVVYVNGGNTANALAIWRVHGIDRALREVWERGGVLGGWSAGAICWFENSVTDSFGPRLRQLGDGLRFLSGSFCPTTTASRSGGRSTRSSSATASSRPVLPPTTMPHSTSRGPSCEKW
jgi:dipeptidase E